MTSRVLAVLLADEISSWIAKGEVVPRYYNPGNLFDRVHIVLLNRDQPDVEVLQGLVGTAQLQVHNFPPPPHFFLRTLGWRRPLVRRWAFDVVERLRPLAPDLIRCHGAHLNAFVAAMARQQLGTPFAVSLHINPDSDTRRWHGDWRAWIQSHAIRGVEAESLREADLVLPVYRSILPFLDRLGVENVRVAYNILSSQISPKPDYRRAGPLRVVSVGRQFIHKNPINLIRALTTVDDVRLTLVGDGPLHLALRREAERLDVAEAVEFRPAVPNDELCADLPLFDVFAVHTDYWELSKSVIEALLAGLPLVINSRSGSPIPELEGLPCVYTDDSPEGYARAFESLAGDETLRARIGQSLRDHALSQWAPEVTEEAVVEEYQRLLGDVAS